MKRKRNPNFPRNKASWKCASRAAAAY
ncbi:MAG: hypothetical protein ACI4S9_07535 [Christensenellales bacterium]